MAKYFCLKCDSQATKPACKKDESASLGTWRCPRCGPTKVRAVYK